MVNAINERAKLVWQRITFSHVTIAFVLFTLVTGILQVSLTGATLTRNLDALKIVNNLSNTSTLRTSSADGVSFVLHNGTVLWCTAPPGSSPDACTVIWSPSNISSSSTAPLRTTTSSSTSIRSTSSSSGQSSTSPSSSRPTATHTSSMTRNNQAFFTSHIATSSASHTSISATHLSRSSSEISKPTKTSSYSSVSPTASSQSISYTQGKNGGNSDHDDMSGFQHIKEHASASSTYALNEPQPTSAFLPASELNKRDDQEPLGQSCSDVLVWADGILRQSSREDAVFLAFVLWNWGISLVAILNESTPHTIAASIAHLLAFGWSIFQLVHTINFRSVFFDVAVHQACNGQNVLPGYWEARSGEQIAVLVISTLAVLISLYLTWRLFADFGWQTFQRVGASPAVNRLYRLALALSVIIQFALFFILAAAILWIDQIKPESSLSYARLNTIGFIVLAILLIPWTLIGWYQVRRGSRALSIIFLLGTVLFLVSFSVLFRLNAFLLFFLSWDFFALMVVMSIILTALALIVGVVCHLHFSMINGSLNGYLQRDEEARPRVRDLSSDVEDVRSPFRSPWPSRRTEWTGFDPEPESVVRPKRSRDASSIA